ncbi:unnamed protein product, partial [Mesorhabditis belari]|uniref:TLC domain-containing protein n=1 Tax=Mesorhabditis belari TaxID=2138241 RepID=A0AAF3J5L1_9BILA
MREVEADEMAPLGAEYDYPPFGKFFETKLLQPTIYYFLLWRALACLVRKYLWKDYSGFRKYRLCNLTICFLHSFFTGSAALIFFFARTRVLFEETIHWWDDSCAHVFLCSIGYFIHDTLDMLSNEWSKWMIELLFHHTLTIIIFLVQLTSQRFQPYAFWVLLMEVSSAFLHARSLLQISGVGDRNSKFFRGFLWSNVIVFIVFRFCVQTWQMWWILGNGERMMHFYYCVGFYGGIVFLTINAFLFYRVLASDGFLGEKRRTAMPSRENQTFTKSNTQLKKNK